LLIKKAKEGVKVRVLFDGVGSYQLSNSYIRELQQAGVETSSFLPPFIAFIDKRINYRNHRKVVVVDGKVGFLGGINIGDEYLGKNPQLGYWRDTHLRLEGDSVHEIQRTFLQDWKFSRKHRLSHKQTLEDSLFFPKYEGKERNLVQVVNSGPDTPWDSILEMYFAAISSAQERIYIVTPYFIPDPSVFMALRTAAVSGVDVRIIIPGVPDTRMIHWATLSYLEELLQVGVRFFQYQKGFIHSKVIIIDHIMASVGTANLDMRSFFSNFELMACLFDLEHIEKLEHDFKLDLQNSEEIMLDTFQRRSKFLKMREIFARMLSPLF